MCQQIIMRFIFCLLFFNLAACSFTESNQGPGVYSSIETLEGNHNGEDESFTGGDGEGFMGGNGQGYAGIIATVHTVHSPTLTNIPKDSRINILGTNFAEGLIVKISGVNCIDVIVKNTTEAYCSLESEVPNVEAVTVMNPNSNTQTYYPDVEDIVWVCVIDFATTVCTSDDTDLLAPDFETTCDEGYQCSYVNGEFKFKELIPKEISPEEFPVE